MLAGFCAAACYVSKYFPVAGWPGHVRFCLKPGCNAPILAEVGKQAGNKELFYNGKLV